MALTVWHSYKQQPTTVDSANSFEKPEKVREKVGGRGGARESRTLGPKINSDKKSRR